MKPYAEATTRERLEAAAGVMGLDAVGYHYPELGCPYEFMVVGNEATGLPVRFAPHDDDDDNNCLQVELMADVTYEDGKWQAWSVREGFLSRKFSEPHDNPNDAVMELAWMLWNEERVNA